MNIKPILGNSDSLQLFPLSYPWAWDMYLECLANHWTPLEIPVADDVALWRGNSLMEEERHLFLSIMAQLTTFDVQRGDETAETLQHLVDPPELKHFLKRLADEEALHTFSYQLVIENFGLDQKDIYSRYERVPEMKRRVTLAQHLSDRARAVWIRQVSQAGYQLTLKDRQEILYSLIFWFLCFEGIWFVMGLAGPIQALARNGKFTQAAQQFQYIVRDEFQHVRFGVSLIKTYIEQNSDCMTPEFTAAVTRLFEETIDCEKSYIEYCLPSPILAYNAKDHIETSCWYANFRARSIGLLDPFPGAEHRFPWMSEQLMIKKEKNFFETRVTEYQTGGTLKWEDDSDR